MGLSMADKEELKQAFIDDKRKTDEIVVMLPEQLRTAVGNYNDKTALREALLEQRQKQQEILERLRTEPDMRTVEFALMYVPDGYAVLASHNPQNNVVTQYKSPTAKGDIRETMIHELHHKDFHMTQYEKLPMNLEQNSLITKHNEISAHLASLVQQRQEYRQAGSDAERQEVLNKIKKSDHSFYAEAIEKGEIDPLSSKPDDFNKEMEFMFHGTQKMWMKNFDAIYQSQITDIKRIHFKTHSYEELQRNDANFALARKNAYTIGGYDFSKFKDDESVKCTDEMTLWQDRAIAAGAKRDYVTNPFPRQDFVEVPKPLGIKTELPEVRDDMSLEQQYQLQVYKKAMDCFTTNYAGELDKLGEPVDKKKLAELVKWNIQAFGRMREEYYYNNISKFSEKLIRAGKNPKANNAKFKEELNKICTVKGVNILKDINKSEVIEQVIQNEDYSYLGIDEKFSMVKFLANIDKQSETDKEAVLAKINQDGQSFSANYQYYLKKKAEYDITCADILKQPFDAHLGDDEDKKVVKAQEWHYGAPRYEEKTEVKTRNDILDLTKPILQDELTAREMKIAIDNALMQVDARQAANNVRQAKEQQKTQQKTNDAPDTSEHSQNNEMVLKTDQLKQNTH